MENKAALVQNSCLSLSKAAGGETFLLQFTGSANLKIVEIL
jgi:hypothetical protein